MAAAATRPLIAEVRERGPLTVAAFMDLALYHPEHGYYARAAQRTGRDGDFFTSVDVGPLFGEILELQIADMAACLGGDAPFDLAEVGAGNGRLAGDILGALERRHPSLLARTRLHLVEASPSARAAQRDTLGHHASRLQTSGPSLPDRLHGVIVANELLDAMPVHQVVMRGGHLREVYVAAQDDRLTTEEGPVSTGAIPAYLDRLGATLEEGWRVEVNLAAPRWIAEAAARLTRGFLLLIDYGHAAADLYSASHAGGTLMTFSRHVARGAEAAGTPSWLERPGEQDITSHVDFTSVQAAAVDAGLTVLGFLDQTYFLLGLLDGVDPFAGLPALQQMKQRLALKTLLLPGGLGSTCKVLLLGKDVGAPALKGCSYRLRVT
ncbi:MAG: class I SAM-dependent methyltransferase [Vicinamibacterales bacterium]